MADSLFRYPDISDPIFPELRNLATISFSSEENDLGKTKIITGYAHSLFTHNGDNEPSSSDPLTILKEAKSGKSFRCVEYSILACALLWAYDIPARMVGLKTRDVEIRKYGAGHVVIEFWDNNFHKWIMCDVQWGIIPKHKDSYLSAYELGERLNDSLTIQYEPVANSRFNAKDTQKYGSWVKEHLYFIDTPSQVSFADTDKRKEQITMLVPEGVKPPKMFQNMFVMNAVYTNSVADFYPNYGAF
jgi:hypothetical protein